MQTIILMVGDDSMDIHKSPPDGREPAEKTDEGDELVDMAVEDRPKGLIDQVPLEAEAE